MSDNSYQLIVRTGPKPGHVYMLISDSMVIGRDPNSDIVINDAEVSRQHARLTMGPDGYQLQDMGSTNGSFVDGTRLEGAVVDLSNSQIVQLGSNVELVYQVIEGVDPMATMVAPMGALPDMGLPELDAVEEDVDTGILPSLDLDSEPASITAFDEMEEKVDDLPSFDEPVAAVEKMVDDLPSFDDASEVVEDVVDDLPSFDAASEVVEDMADELPSFDDVVEDAGAAVEEALPSFDDAPEDATMIFSESMADDLDLPSFDEPAAMAEDAVEAVEEALPSFDEPEPLPSFDDPEPLPSFDDPEPLPSFDDPEPLPSFGDPEPMPSFDEPAKAEPMMAKSEPPPLPSFDPEPIVGEVSKVGGDEGGGGFMSNRRNVMIAVGVLVGACICCASTIGLYAAFVGF